MSTFLVIALVVSAVAAIWDMRTGRMPNWLTLGGIAAGVFGHLVQSWLAGGFRAGLTSAAWSIGGAVFCALAPLVLYWKGGMGGGDLKLFAAIGALCHPMLGIECQVYALAVAALLAPARLAYDGRLFAVLAGSLALLVNPLLPRARRRGVPPEMLTWFRLGPAIFGGTLLTLLAHAYEILASRS
jgi:prepilin peptidase CpaA